MKKTLLDEFAMAALTGILSDSSLKGNFEAFAQDSYLQAQAMMEERKKHVKEAEDDGWIEWGGGNCPVDGDVKVEIITMMGEQFIDDAIEFNWHHAPDCEPIIKYRVLK